MYKSEFELYKSVLICTDLILSYTNLALSCTHLVSVIQLYNLVSVFQMCNFEFYKSGLYKSVYRYEFEFDTSDFELYMFVSKMSVDRLKASSERIGDGEQLSSTVVCRLTTVDQRNLCGHGCLSHARRSGGAERSVVQHV